MVPYQIPETCELRAHLTAVRFGGDVRGNVREFRQFFVECLHALYKVSRDLSVVPRE